MSYFQMDHAAWVQRQIGPNKLRGARRTKGIAKGWQAAPDTLSEFQAKVFDILGMTFGGVHNARIAWDAIEWRIGSGIGIPMTYQDLSTFDFSEMTTLVFLCHEARIRCWVNSHGFKETMLVFSPRVATGGMSERHPNLDEAVEAFRARLPSDHRIIYREAVRDTADAEPAKTIDAGRKT